MPVIFRAAIKPTPSISRPQQSVSLSKAQEQARHEAARLIEEAKADIAQEKAAAISEIRAQVAELSVKVAEKILRKELDSSENQMETIDRLLDEVSVK